MSEPTLNKLTGGRLLARNTVLSFFGQGAPLLAGLFAIPILIDGLGTDRFGVLTLAWMVIGYFSLFDLGLARALTKIVAEKLGAGQHQGIRALIWTALFLMLLLGLMGMLGASLLSSWLVKDVFEIPETLQPETLRTFYLLALSVPIVISTVGLQGVLEAQQRFDLITALRLPMGIFSFIGPLLVLPFSNSLFPIVAVLVAGRTVAWLVCLLLCLYTMPVLRGGIEVQRKMVAPLLRFGGWMTVGNMLGGVITYLDRFLIGTLLSTAAVAYYATPFEIITKVWIIPVAAIGVLFPAFSASYGQDRTRTTHLFWKGVKFTFLAVFPIVVFLVYFAREFLLIWLGIEFSENSTFVLQMLAIAILIDSMGRLPSALLQSIGRPDLKAKIHCAELPLFAVLLWGFLHYFGLNGAAIAFLVLICLDSTLFFTAAFWIVPEIKSQRVDLTALLIVFGLIASLFVPLLFQGIEPRLIVMILLIAASPVIIWRNLLDGSERQLFRTWITFYRKAS